MAAARGPIKSELTPSQKKAIRYTAERLGVDESELMRDAAQDFENYKSDGRLEALIERVSDSTQRANDAIDQAIKLVRESNERIDAMSRQGHR